MFKDDLFNIREQIYEIASKPESKRKQDVLDKILSKKLDRNYENYAEMITRKINYILSRNNYKVIKALNKMAEEKDDEDNEYE